MQLWYFACKGSMKAFPRNKKNLLCIISVGFSYFFLLCIAIHFYNTNRVLIREINMNMENDTITYHSLLANVEQENEMLHFFSKEGLDREEVKKNFTDYVKQNQLSLQYLKDGNSKGQHHNEDRLQFAAEGSFLNLLKMWGELQKDFPDQKITIKTIVRLDSGQNVRAEYTEDSFVKIRAEGTLNYWLK